MANSLDEALGDIPAGLRNPLVSDFEDLLAEYRAGDWEKVGLKAGKLCETTYTILKGHTSGSYPAAPSKPTNMVSACTALEGATGFSRPVRIQIPRVLIALYELRNNRAIGHVSGDLNPNHMDAEFFLRGAKWMVAELVRVFTKASTDQARDLIEEVTERILPVVWDTGTGKKILNTTLSTADKALVLTYASPGGATAKTLCSWIGYSNLSRFRNQVLGGLDGEALVNFDTATDRVTISPTGMRRVEAKKLLDMK